ncbi:hypothetical protein niasHT_028956 [Heterodera trifolii]|uniref:Gustatory receptor n=1 Tax=Heterodera trifolii TaxID=157864 RepID=A0ABD2K1Y4_9BILA
MPSPSGTVLLFGYIFYSFELFTYGFVLAIAFLNLAVICPTKILHANLKSILITQSIAEMLFVFVRSIMLIQKFISDDLFAPANLCLQFIIAFVNTVTNGKSQTLTKFNFITQTMSTVISLFEYLLIIVIRKYNHRRYINQIEEASPKNYHIGQRYQVSDNVKTAKQLSPTFLCLFLTNLASNFLIFVISFGFVTESNKISLTFSFGVWADAVLSATTELTIMTHHPLLKRRLIILLKKVFRMNQNQIGDVPTNAMELTPSSVNPTNGRDKMDAHFKMLQQLWNNYN